MKKKGFICAVSLLVLTAAMTGCSKKNTSPSNSGTVTKTDTITKAYKQDQTNYLLASVNGNAIASMVGIRDSLRTIEIDSNGVITLLALVISFTQPMYPTATATLDIYFFKPASLTAGTTIDVYQQTTAGLDYAPDESGVQSYADYQAGYGITGSSGTFTITANDVTGKRITGTFTKIVATDQPTSFQATITGGSFSVSY